MLRRSPVVALLVLVVLSGAPFASAAAEMHDTEFPHNGSGISPPTAPAGDEPDFLREKVDELMPQVDCVEVLTFSVGPSDCGSHRSHYQEIGPIGIGFDVIDETTKKAAIEQCEALAGGATIPRAVCMMLDLTLPSG